jgi:hypothetical protein
MPQEPTITLAVATVLREFVVDISQPRYGYALNSALCG